jgi:para-aminobenzoate synthetase component 1
LTNGIEPLPWRDPVEAMAAFADEPYAGLLLSGGPGGRWSYLVRSPEVVVTVTEETTVDLVNILAPLLDPSVQRDPAGPPFQGGVVGLAAYDMARRLETFPASGFSGWPQLTLGKYAALLAFDHSTRRILAVGRGAADWLEVAPRRRSPETPLCDKVRSRTSRRRHEAAVAEVVERIRAGEIFQANIARRWVGALAGDAGPFDVFCRLASASPASHAAFWRLPGRVLVSNSPEQFLSIRAEDGGLTVETRPIKGTRPRAADPDRDAALAADLLASPKDRAENLMIVDLMRNDLARCCAPGSVEVTELCRLQSLANVHHLVSTIRGRLQPGRTAWDLFRAAFPPGSVTGAPKIQAMNVIARHEPPRGPHYGSLFWAGHEGALEASVLIRTLACRQVAGRWRFEAQAGGGVVADSDPVAERIETEDKFSAIRAALTGVGP